MRKIVLLCAASLILVLLGQCMSLATTQSDELLWRQRPDMDRGLSYSSEAWVESIAADDWLSQGTSPVTNIKWWGSYWTTGDGPSPNSSLFYGAPPVQIDAFRITIGTDVPRGMDKNVPFSHPGTPIWGYITPNYNEKEFGSTNSGRKLYEYSVVVPEEKKFNPQAGEWYWITIEALRNGSPTQWGWVESRDSFADANAVQMFRGSPWVPQVGCPCVNNLAFELVSDPPVPEPGSFLALAMGTIGMAGLAAKRRNRS